MRFLKPCDAALRACLLSCSLVLAVALKVKELLQEEGAEEQRLVVARGSLGEFDDPVTETCAAESAEVPARPDILELSDEAALLGVKYRYGEDLVAAGWRAAVVEGTARVPNSDIARLLELVVHLHKVAAVEARFVAAPVLLR